MSESEQQILLFNPKSANAKHRLPNSILQIAASIHGKHKYVIVDGNLEQNPLEKIISYLQTGQFKFFASTVMPGPQTKQAIPFTKYIKENFPGIITIWGGYFPSSHSKTVIESSFVDFIVKGQGDFAFPKLIDALINVEKETIKTIQNVISKDQLICTELFISDLESLPEYPYDYLNEFYSIENYLPKTFLGKKTLTYHSSFGCPYHCSFCAIVPIFNGKWTGKSANNIFQDIQLMKSKYSIDSIEFSDNNFFTSKKRVLDFSRLMKNQEISWWGEGRIDTLNQYTDEELKLLKEGGCKMIFLGAESGNNSILKKMNKGGNVSSEEIETFVRRAKSAGIIPELSFVLGFPDTNKKNVRQQINADIKFIKKIKRINKHAEIIIYIYSPVPTNQAELTAELVKTGFKFPEKLEDWLNPEWENFDLRRNPLTPWLDFKMISKIKNFETVLNAKYPTISDFKIKGIKKLILKSMSVYRYGIGFYNFPIEIKYLQKKWKYRKPEIEGFYAE